MLQLILKDIKMMFHFKQLLVISIIFPLLILGLLGFAFTDFVEHKSIVDQIDIGLVNQDNSQASEILVNDFMSNDAFSKLFRLIEHDEVEAKEKFSTGEINAIIEIPQGFSQSLFYFENEPIHLTINPEEPLKSLVLKNIMESYSKYVQTTDIAVYSLYKQMKAVGIPNDDIRRVNDAFSVDMIFTSLGRDKLFQEKPITTIPSSTSMEYFIIASGVLLVMYMGLIGANLMIYEKDTMCLDRYMISSGSILKLILSKIIVLVLLGLFQVLLFLFPLGMIMGIDLGYSVFDFLVFLVISLLHISSLAIFVGSIIKTEELATLVGNLGILIIGLIGGSFFPLKLMPSFMYSFSQLTPNHWIIKGFLFLIKDYKLDDILSSIVVLSIGSILMVTISFLKLRHRSG